MGSITLHQSLHGYKDGHRALATSTKLDSQDSKTLLVLSDVSGPGSRLEMSGYLTGYPLPTAGFYALARTWPAPEMSRPGCVWTHTLLIDFADLATINAPTNLLRCFQRPEGLTYTSYGNPISFYEGSPPPSVGRDTASISKIFMNALYEYPSMPIISFEGHSESSEAAVLAIWGQQWPRLRRSFRFCTFSSSDRSTKEALFDLQLLPPAMPSVKSRFTNAIEARASASEPDWLKIATDELINTSSDGLRQFLFQAGSDLRDGRSSFANLCRIFGLLKAASDDQNNIEIVLSLIPVPSDTTGARALKGMVVRHLFANQGTFNKKVLSYIVEHLDLLDERVTPDEYANFGQKLLKLQPKLFLKLKKTGALGNQVFKETLSSVTAKDIVVAVKKAPQILTSALKNQPTLLFYPDIWSLIDVENIEVLNGLARLRSLGEALHACITAKRLDLSEALLQHVAPVEILSTVHQAYVSGAIEAHSLHEWIGAVGSLDVIGTFLCLQKPIDCHFLLAVSQTYTPDDIPSMANQDPWLSALQSRQGELDYDDEVYFRAFLLTRALGDRSTNAAELALFGFDTIDRAAATSTLNYHLWQQLERRLPWPMFWQDWDKCYRLRKGVSEKSIEDNWGFEIFINLTNDESTFAMLVFFANSSHRGRQYLKSIESELKKSTDPRASKKRDTIKHIMKHY